MPGLSDALDQCFPNWGSKHIGGCIVGYGPMVPVALQGITGSHKRSLVSLVGLTTKSIGLCGPENALVEMIGS